MSSSHPEWGPHSAEVLLDMLHTRLSQLETRKNQAEGDERIQLEDAWQKMKEAVEKMEHGVESMDELKWSTEALAHEQHLIGKLEKVDIDQVDVEYILNSDLRYFLDDNFLNELSQEQVKMQFTDSVKTILGKEEHEIEEEAIEAWAEYKKGIEAEISDLQEKQEQGPLGLDLIPHLRNQISKGRTAWIKRKKAEIELEQSRRARLLNPNRDAIVLSQLKAAFEERQALELKRIQDYIETRHQIVLGEFEKLRSQSENSPDRQPSQAALKSIEETIQQAERFYLDKPITNPQELKAIAQSFTDAQQVMKRIGQEAKEREGQRAEVERQVQVKYARLKNSLKGLRSLDLKKLAAANGEPYPPQLQVIETPDGPFRMEAVHRKELAALALFNGEDSAANNRLEALDGMIENLNKVDYDKVLELHRDLDTLNKQVSDAVDAQKAGDTIEALKTANDVDSIKSILHEKLGDEHLRFVSEADFESNYRQFTQKGDMVFYERGDEWAIIMNEDAFGPNANVEFLKRQITHELLHLEFEKDHQKKNEVMAAFTLAHPGQWQDIKTAFLAMANQNQKAAPTPAGWRDEDILSEIYAMQNELGNQWDTAGTAKAKLNNLLMGSAAAASLKDLTEETDGYNDPKNAPEPIYRGYEGSEEGFQTPISETGAPIDRAEGNYLVFKEEIDKLEGRLKEAQKSPRLSSLNGAPELVEAMLTFNKNTAALNEDAKALDDPSILNASITARNEKVKDDITKIESAISEAAKGEDNKSMGFLRRSWNNTKFISFKGVVKMFTNTKEFLDRALERRVAEEGARLGMALFSGTGAGRDALSKKLAAEADSVAEWEKGYKNMDMWELTNELRSMSRDILSPNKDQLKTILRLMAQKGIINWTDPHLWKILNKLQSASEFNLGDIQLIRDPVLLRDKLSQALGEIYDFDEFPTLERNNRDTYESTKKKYDTVHESTSTKLTERMDELLIRHHRGENVDPILYESIIEYCMTQGKSSGEVVMFHLISGIASGILSPERGIALSKHCSTWPPMDWFTTLSPIPTQEDFKKICKTHFRTAYKEGTLKGKGGDAFKNWFWTTIQTNKTVIQRAKSSVGNRNWDHDWGRTIVCLGDVDTIQRFFAGRAGQKETKTTAIGNVIAGMVQSLEENAKNQAHADRNEFARIASIMAMTEGVLNGSYKSENDTITRGTSEINDDVPREASAGHHPGLTTRQHRQINVNFLLTLDEEFFGYLQNLKELKTPREKQAAGQAAASFLRKYPALAAELPQEIDIDQIYSQLGRICQVILQSKSEPEYRAILARFRAK